MSPKPPSRIGNEHARELGFHVFQIFDVGFGSGVSLETAGGSDLYIDSCTGSGPLYDVWLMNDNPHPDSGVDKIQSGDHLFVAAENDSSPILISYGLYRYDITSILTTPTVNSGEFRVKYIDDTESAGDDSPCDLYANREIGYDFISDTDIITVSRDVNVPFLLSD